MQRVRVNDNLGYIKKHPKWFCSNPNNFRFVTSAEQLLEKCFPRKCCFLVEFDKLGKKKKRTYLSLLGAKKNGFWICQEKTIFPNPPPQKMEELPEKQVRDMDQVTSSIVISSGQKSKVKCTICFAEIEVPSNQLLVFCPNCDVQYTNPIALEED